MKSNLDKLYKTNAEEEVEGIWFEIAEGVKFRIKRFGGKNGEAFKRSMAKHHKPHAHRIQKGTLPADQENEIMTRVFVETSLIDWEGVEIDGECKDFERELAVKFLNDLPELANDLIGYATDAENYREDLGNS